jgi:hypothetical protein
LFFFIAAPICWLLQGSLAPSSPVYTHLSGKSGYSCAFIFKYYCVGALNGWQIIWEERISHHGNPFIGKLQKDTPSDLLCAVVIQRSGGLYCKAVSEVNKDMENVMAPMLIFTCFPFPATSTTNYVRPEHKSGDANCPTNFSLSRLERRSSFSVLHFPVKDQPNKKM